MKKNLLCLLVAASAMFGASAYAADAGYENGRVTVNAENVKTVLITKGDDPSSENIYYVNQAETGGVLNAAAGFAMKANPEDGTYTLILGFNEVGETAKQAEKISFTISSKPADVDMEALANAVANNTDGTFNVGFVTPEGGIDLSKYNSLKIRFGTGDDAITIGYPLDKLDITKVSGGAVMLGVQINNVPEQYKDAITMGFSAEVIQASEEGTEK